MTRLLFPVLFILAGIATIVFSRTIASNAVQASRMFRIPLLLAEKDMPYYWIAIGVFTIFVGILFLFPSIGPYPMTPQEAMARSALPIAIIMIGTALITFNRHIAATSSRMWHGSFSLLGKYFPSLLIALGVITILVGTFYLFRILRL